MEVMVARGAGVDVAKKGVVVCVLAGEPGAVVVPEIRPFGTMTADLERLAAWLAELPRHGLVRPSFIPGRELTRYRTALIRERASEVHRLQEAPEAASIKLAAVLTDVTGASGQAILDALVNGEEDPSTPADLAHGRVRKKREALERSLVGPLSPMLTFVVKQQPRHLRELDDPIATCDAEVERRMRPFAEHVARLDELPGVGARTAQVIVAEPGVDMARFPSHRHAAAWAGMCPGNNAGGGKRRRARTRKGSPRLRGALAEAAWAAGRCRSGYLPEHFRHLAARRGKKRAIAAVGHAILVIAYHPLQRAAPARHRLHRPWPRTLRPSRCRPRQAPLRQAPRIARVHRLARTPGGRRLIVAQDSFSREPGGAWRTDLVLRTTPSSMTAKDLRTG